MDPAKWFVVFQVFALWHLVGEGNTLQGSHLGNQDNAANFFYHLVFFRGYAVEVACYLSPSITNRNKLLNQILRHDIGIPTLLNFIRSDIDIIRSQM